jgi:hypothetical protein
MDLWVAGARYARKDNADFVELVLRDGTACYGPVRIPAGKMYASRQMDLNSAKNLIERLSKALPGCNAVVKDYGKSQKVVWVYTKTAPEAEHVWREFAPLLRQVMTSERIANNFKWPFPFVHIDDSLVPVLHAQNGLHSILENAWSEKVVPLLDSGATFGDCVRALTGGKNQVLRYAKERKKTLSDLSDELFVPPVLLPKAASYLNGKCADGMSVEHCWQDAQGDSLGTILYAPGGITPAEGNIADCRNYLLSNTGCFDIEVGEWWTNHPWIYSVAIVKERGDDVVFGLFKANENIEAKGRKARYVQFGSEKKLIAAMASEIRKLGLRVTQNGLSYDYPVSDKFPGVFLVNSDNSPPVSLNFRRGMLDEHGRKGSRDAVDLDTAFFARAHLPLLLPDFKLETLGDFFSGFGLDTGYKKMQTYEENDALVVVAQKGDVSAADKIMAYTYEDSIVDFKIGKWVAPVMMNVASDAGVDVFDAFHETPRNIALIAGDKLHWDNLHVVRNHAGYQRFYKDEWHKEELAEVFDKRLKWEFVKGAHKDVTVAYVPLWRFVYPFIANRAGKLIERANSASNPLEAMLYHQVIDGFAAELFADLEPKLLGYLSDRLNEYWLNAPESVLYGKYGSSRNEILSALDSTLESGLSKMFSGVKVVNRHNNLFFISGINDAASRGFIPLGVANKAINIKPGIVVHNMNNTILSTGMKIPSRKKRAEHPGRNSDCAYEIMAVHDFLNTYFESGIKKAFALANKYKKNLNTKNHSLLAFRVSQNEPLSDRGVEQQRTFKARIEKKFGLKPGESVICGVSDGDFVEYDPASRSYKGNFEPDRKYYRKEIFGAGSKLRKIMKAVGG